MGLFGSLLIIGLIVALIYAFVTKKERADKKLLPVQLDAFNQAVKYKDIPQIMEYGEKLIYNRHVTYDIVLSINKILEAISDDTSEWKNFAELIFNKKLDFKNSHGTSTFS